MKADIRGPFRVWDDLNIDRTPAGIKARALLALLLLSPKQRRTRAWLQDKLWSDRTPDQASVSFRQALSQTRKALGPLAAQLQSDRTAVWLTPAVALDMGRDGLGIELLDDLDLKDPEFVDWLRDLRQQHSSRDAAKSVMQPIETSQSASGQPDDRPVVAIVFNKPAQTLHGRFLARELAGRIANDLNLSGQLQVTLNEGALPDRDADQAPRDPRQVVIEIETLGEVDTWYVAIRTIVCPGNRCVWTGRLQLPMSLAQIWNSPETVRLVNKTISTVVDALTMSGRPSPFTSLQRAIRRIFEFDRAGLESADLLLREAQESDEVGVALAWRGFVRLTSAFEFRDDSSALRDEAAVFCADAMARSQDNPIILGLSARVQMELIGDFDFGNHLAIRAVQAGDENPYALHALSRAYFFQGEFRKGDQTAERARHASAGMSNSFNWDMLCCHSALSLGLFDEALGHALSCHRKKPFFRPALRYLVALYLMAGRMDEATHYEGRLRRLEPDFSRQLMLQDSYPMDTLRKLGLADRIRQHLQ